MSKYIKLEDAIESYNQAVTNLVESEMEELDLGDFTECSFNTTQIKLIARMIASLPSIDIVHCKECMRCQYEVIEETMPIYIYCDLWKSETEWDSFCSYGERIDDE